MAKLMIILLLHIFFFHSYILKTEAKCKPKNGCHLALASFYMNNEINNNVNLTRISELFNQNISEILKYNPNINLSNTNTNITNNLRVHVPFTCQCIHEHFLGHMFTYTMQHGDTYARIAHETYAGLTDEESMAKVNVGLDPNRISDGTIVNVVVNCSCGDAHVSKDYGLFLTYPVVAGEGLAEVAAVNDVPVDLVQKYNPGSDFSAGLVLFVPARGLS